MSNIVTPTKLRSGDEVIVIAGKDLGKKGTLREIIKNKNRGIVTGLNMVKKHTKPNPELGITGGVVEQEAAIDLSNLAIWNPKKKLFPLFQFKLRDDFYDPKSIAFRMISASLILYMIY